MEEGRVRDVEARLRERIRRTPSTESFRFDVEGGFSFLPGQFVRVILDEGNPRNGDLNKYLSLSCPPGRDYIEVTKKLSDSAFSRRLQALAPGGRVRLRGPMGTCVFTDDMAMVGFLVGGIGITPVMSIVGHIVGRGLGTDVALVYSNRTEEETAFRTELEQLQREGRNVRVHCFLTRGEPRESSCASGRVDREAILSRIPDFAERTCFVYGPPKMVETMADLCRDIGCPPERLKTEGFTGY